MKNINKLILAVGLMTTAAYCPSNGLSVVAEATRTKRDVKQELKNLKNQAKAVREKCRENEKAVREQLKLQAEKEKLELEKTMLEKENAKLKKEAAKAAGGEVFEVVRDEIEKNLNSEDKPIFNAVWTRFLTACTKFVSLFIKSWKEINLAETKPATTAATPPSK